MYREPVHGYSMSAGVVAKRSRCFQLTHMWKLNGRNVKTTLERLDVGKTEGEILSGMK